MTSWKKSKISTKKSKNFQFVKMDYFDQSDISLDQNTSIRSTTKKAGCRSNSAAGFLLSELQDKSESEIKSWFIN
ncbi:hypothetical protein BO224_09195 [Erysipelotrichaceae bacterium NYU-BL-E8]|nr:hypothetical protein BO224_09195 [Erysipelotrichaceae bacterium NYU-BL-E8]